jgi:hypothetical protein
MGACPTPYKPAARPRGGRVGGGSSRPCRARPNPEPAGSGGPDTGRFCRLGSIGAPSLLVRLEGWDRVHARARWASGPKPTELTGFGVHPSEQFCRNFPWPLRLRRERFGPGHVGPDRPGKPGRSRPLGVPAKEAAICRCARGTTRTPNPVSPLPGLGADRGDDAVRQRQGAAPVLPAHLGRRALADGAQERVELGL